MRTNALTQATCNLACIILSWMADVLHLHCGQSKGADRVASLAQSETSADKLISLGVAHKLTSLLEAAESPGEIEYGTVHVA